MRRRSRRLAPLLLALCLLLAAAPAEAQTSRPRNAPAPYALIFGTVYGPDGRSMQGVPLKIRRADQKRAKYHLYSDRAGEFAQRVPPGPAEYVVWADLKRRRGDKRPLPEVRVKLENDERVDISLHLTE